MELNKAKQQIKEADTAIGAQKSEIEKVRAAHPGPCAVLPILVLTSVRVFYVAHVLFCPSFMHASTLPRQ